MKYDIISKYCPEFGEVRTVEKDGMTWYGATDVLRILGYVNPHRMLEYWKIKPIKLDVTYINVGQIGRRKSQTLNFISKEDVYLLITNSQMSKAKEFRHWLFGDVLPTMEETGMYILPEAEDELEKKFNEDPKLAINYYKEEHKKVIDLTNLLEKAKEEKKIVLQDLEIARNEATKWENNFNCLDAQYDAYLFDNRETEMNYKEEIRNLKYNLLKLANEIKSLNSRLDVCEQENIDIKAKNTIMKVSAQVHHNLRFQEDLEKWYYVAPDCIPLIIVHDDIEDD